jgi:hypothetical protein
MHMHEAQRGRLAGQDQPLAAEAVAGQLVRTSQSQLSIDPQGTGLLGPRLPQRQDDGRLKRGRPNGRA